MKKLSLEQMENVEGGKFFGRSSTDHGDWCENHFSFFWITWTTDVYTAADCDY